ncbi:MAG TPA: hypothetical protein VFR15_07840 [Chloroflexia bacterium]|nr:hypothetical protein [Chloroflexia bacterium]
MKRSTNLAASVAITLALICGGAVTGRLLHPGGARPAEAANLVAQPVGPLTPSVVGSGFTYQGRLLNNGVPVSGSYDFTFRLFSQPSGGVPLSGPISVTTVITAGLFTTSLDFGAPAFDGEARFMEVAARQSGGGAYTTLSPRQPIASVPYALYALKARGQKNVVTVAKEGGDHATVTAALAAITDNSPFSRYVIRVAPGVYTETVTMKEYVDIEGSGERNTTIAQVGSALANTGTVVGTNNAQLRSLTVRNTGGNTNAIAVYNNGASPSLAQVTASASGGSNLSSGVYSVGFSASAMTNVTVNASGGGNNWGIRNEDSSPTLSNVTVTTSGSAGSFNYAVLNQDSSPTLSNVTISSLGGQYSIGMGNINSSPTLGNVRIIASGGSSASWGVQNSSSSPSMSNMTINVSGPGDNLGVLIEDSSSPTLSSVTVSVSGGTTNVGVENNAASPTLTNVTISASGSGANYGVRNSNSSSRIQGSAVSASGGSINMGVFNTATTGSHTVKIDNSKITGSSNSIFNGAQFTTRVGASQLEGGPVVPGGGTVSCAGVYDENYVFFASTCP